MYGDEEDFGGDYRDEVDGPFVETNLEEITDAGLPFGVLKPVIRKQLNMDSFGPPETSSTTSLPQKGPTVVAGSTKVKPSLQVAFLCNTSVLLVYSVLRSPLSSPLTIGSNNFSLAYFLSSLFFVLVRLLKVDNIFQLREY